MSKDIMMGQFVPGDSFLHRMDTRFKLALAIWFIVAVFLGKTWLAYGALTAFVVLAIAASRLPVGLVFRSVKPLLFILVFTLGFNLFLVNEGEILWQWHFLRITQGGIRQAILMSVRLVMLVMGTSLLTLTTSPLDLTDGLESLMKPLKWVHFPAHELAMMMSIALRFIPTLMEEADRIMKAQMARGADFESGNLLRRAKAMVPLLVPLFVAAFRRAEDLAMAMEARCYQGGEGRTRMRQFHATWRDAVGCICMAALTCAMIFL
nr:energy-coupling factor transporter transmembrane component T [bacterium]